MATDIKKFKGDSAEKKEDKSSKILSCTFVENMREQPKATTGLIYSPRRPGKSGENDVHTGGKMKTAAKSSVAKSSDTSPKRKSLQILQPCADGQKQLTGGRSTTKGKRKVKVSSRSRQTKLHISKINEETESSSESSKYDTISDGQTSTDEAYALMVQEHAPEKYWELLAEERREALEETLKENMKLYEIIEELKAENKALLDKANDTDYFATMYKISQTPDVIIPEESQNN